MKPFTVNEENFTREVLDAKKPVLLFFHADRCAFCRRTDPVFDELSEKTDNVIFAKTDADANTGLTSMLGIMGLPAFILFDSGKEVSRAVGIRTKAQLIAMLEEKNNSDLQFSR